MAAVHAGTELRTGPRENKKGHITAGKDYDNEEFQ
jgi:hypothetical protein